jgi:hypothetical protein
LIAARTSAVKPHASHRGLLPLPARRPAARHPWPAGHTEDSEQRRRLATLPSLEALPIYPAASQERSLDMAADGGKIDGVLATYTLPCYGRGGSSHCNPSTGVYEIDYNDNRCCTRDCTQMHEEQHVSDLEDCCQALKSAIDAGGDPTDLIGQYNTWMSSGVIDWTECRAYKVSESCAGTLWAQNNCDNQSSQCCDEITDYLTIVWAQKAHYCGRAPATRPPCPFVPASFAPATPSPTGGELSSPGVGPGAATVAPPAAGAPGAQVCSRDLQVSPVGKHAYIDAPPFRYAILSPTCPQSWYDNPIYPGTGGQKWDNSPDPCGKDPTCLPCTPAPGVTDVDACLRSAFSAYANPSLYRLLGPNSNTFAGTLARTCCAGMVPKPEALGWMPGWDDSPAPAHGSPPCPPGPSCT